MAELKVSDIGRAIGIQKTKTGASAKESAWLISGSCCNLLLSATFAIICGLAVGYVISHYDLDSIKHKLKKLAVERGYLHDTAEERIMELGLTLEDILRREAAEAAELDNMEYALEQLEGNFENWLMQNVQDKQKVAEGLAFFQEARETVAWYTQEIRRDSIEATTILGQVTDLMDTDDVVDGPKRSRKSPLDSAPGMQDIIDKTQSTFDYTKNKVQDWFQEALKKIGANEKDGAPQLDSTHRKELATARLREKFGKKASGYSQYGRYSKSNTSKQKHGGIFNQKIGVTNEKEAESKVSKTIEGKDLETRIDQFFVAVDQANKIKFPKEFATKFQALKEDMANLGTLRKQNRAVWQRKAEHRIREFSQLLKDYNIFDVEKHTNDVRETGRYIHDISLELEFIVKVQDNKVWLKALRERYRNGDLSESRFFRALRTDQSWKVVLDWLFNKAGHKSILLFDTYVRPKAPRAKATSFLDRRVDERGTAQKAASFMDRRVDERNTPNAASLVGREKSVGAPPREQPEADYVNTKLQENPWRGRNQEYRESADPPRTRRYGDNFKPSRGGELGDNSKTSRGREYGGNSKPSRGTNRDLFPRRENNNQGWVLNDEWN